MDKSRHNRDLVVYLCGDHGDPMQFYFAERNIHLATDYTVLNPNKGEQTYNLLERMEMLHHSDVVVVLPSYFNSAEALAEVAYAHAESIESHFLEDFLAPYENVRDCD